MWSVPLVLFSVAFGCVYCKTSTVYYKHQFTNNELCGKLRCGPNDLCIVSEGKAFCVNADDLHKLEGKHVDSEGKQIHHKQHERKHFKEGHKKAIHEHEHLPRHFQHNEQPNKECGEKELRNMGGRLLQWFTEMHRVAGAGVAINSNKDRVSCRPDVAWMFEQWDGNNDGELSVKELVPLESDANEKCLKAFIDRCDTDAGNDDVITKEEWCDCFAWADDTRHEPPCHAAKHMEDPHLLGAFHPRCTLDGYFKPEQCHDNTCWCVDKFGREFEKSRVAGELPDCGQYATDMDAEEAQELQAEL